LNVKFETPNLNNPLEDSEISRSGDKMEDKYTEKEVLLEVNHVSLIQKMRQSLFASSKYGKFLCSLLKGASIL